MNNVDYKYKTIWVTFQKEGIHSYPEASERSDLSDVYFLSHPHRHIFHFRVEMQVNHYNRDVEFILLKRELESLYQESILQLNNKSCEMICDDLIDYLTNKYSNRDITVSVSEDNENGATISYKRNVI